MSIRYTKILEYLYNSKTRNFLIFLSNIKFNPSTVKLITMLQLSACPCHLPYPFIINAYVLHI